MCGRIHRNIRNKRRHIARIKFYKTIAIPTFSYYASEAWAMTKKMWQDSKCGNAVYSK